MIALAGPRQLDTTRQTSTPQEPADGSRTHGPTWLKTVPVPQWTCSPFDRRLTSCPECTEDMWTVKQLHSLKNMFLQDNLDKWKQVAQKPRPDSFSTSSPRSQRPCSHCTPRPSRMDRSVLLCQARLRNQHRRSRPLGTPGLAYSTKSPIWPCCYPCRRY